MTPEDVIAEARKRWPDASYIHLQLPEYKWRDHDEQTEASPCYLQVFDFDSDTDSPVFDESAATLSELAQKVRGE